MRESDAAGPSLQAAMSRLWLQCQPAMRDRVAAIAAAAEALGRGSLDESVRRAGEVEAHKLAGVAGSFGHWETTELAREAEEILRGSAPIPLHEAERLTTIAAALPATLVSKDE